jgi:DNA-binding NtrC family response regulator
MKQRILIADDDAAVSENLTSLLTRWGYEVESATDASQALERTLAFQPSVVIADLFMSGLGGLEFLRSVHEELPTTPVIVLTGHGTIEHAVAAMKEGAFDYLTKPVDPKGLKAILEKASAKAVDVREGAVLRRHAWPTGGASAICSAVSEEMQEVYRLVEMAASTTAPVMISGENRDRQGAGRADDPRFLRARKAPLRCRELFSGARDTAGERAVRVREGGVHRCIVPPGRLLRAR